MGLAKRQARPRESYGNDPAASAQLVRARRRGAQRLLGPGFDPIGDRAVPGIDPAIPEQNTNPPAMIPWQ
jgi:hypothetical protein